MKMKNFPIRSWIFCILWVAYCGGCILWGNVFAKLHINIPGSLIPIFIGEILLFMGIVISWPEIMALSWKARKIMLALTTVLLVATTIGFFRYGPLAFRHAAPFTYVFLAIIIYKHVIDSRITVFLGVTLYLILLLVRFGFPGNEFYAFSVWSLFCFVINLTFRRANISKKNRYIYVTIISIFSFPLYLLFNTARTFIVANSVSFLSLFVGVFLISKISILKRFVFLALCISALLGSIYLLADRNAVRSMVNIQEVMRAVDDFDAEYNRAKADYKIKEAFVSLYRPVGVVDYSPVNQENTSTTVGTISSVPQKQSVVKAEEKGQPQERVEEKPLTVAIAPPAAQKQAIVKVEDKVKPREKIEEKPLTISITPPVVQKQAILRVENKVIAPEKTEKKSAILDTASYVPQKQAIVKAAEKVKIQEKIEEKRPKDNKLRDYGLAKQNLLFRIFIWKGLFEELFEERAIFGFGFGKPFRPMTTQVLGWTERMYVIDGWISTHNSWFNLIYLFGIIGFLIALCALFLWGRMFFVAVNNKDFWGILLCSALINFMVGAFSQPLFEQPHYAIFFWGLLGIVFRQVYFSQGKGT